MAWLPTYQPVWTHFPTQTQGPGVGIREAIQIMRNYDYPPPSGYIFLKILGAGGCGKVYLAKHCFTGCLYAVKCVKIIDAYTALLAEGLWKEIMILNGKPHPHLITCYGTKQSSTDSSIKYLILEYMDMGSVKDLYRNPTIMITEASVRECISHVLVGLVHLHALYIIHRDLKGENILKDSKGFYKIADFGLSKRCNIDATCGSNCLMTVGVGTNTHMAPEVRNPTSTLSVPYNWKADIWSLGCLVLEISSRGQFTIDANYQQAVYAVPPFMSRLGVHFIQCCLHVNPDNRATSSMLLNHDWFKMQL